MGAVRHPEQAVLFIGSLFSDPEVFGEVLPELRRAFGGLLFLSADLSWDITDYYNHEFGAPILRNFVFFDTVSEPSFLAEAKLFTNQLETKFSAGGRRRINLDPGYLTLAKVVLASTKNYSHRIYIGRGIYCELELFFKDGAFQTLPYTYPDFREGKFIDIFAQAREKLKRLLVSRR